MFILGLSLLDVQHPCAPNNIGVLAAWAGDDHRADLEQRELQVLFNGLGVDPSRLYVLGNYKYQCAVAGLYTGMSMACLHCPFILKKGNGADKKTVDVTDHGERDPELVKEVSVRNTWKLPLPPFLNVPHGNFAPPVLHFRMLHRAGPPGKNAEGRQAGRGQTPRQGLLLALPGRRREAVLRRRGRPEA